jgi:hypothetical protein
MPQVGAQGPIRLVLDARGGLAAVGLEPGVRALDDAARAASMVIDLLAWCVACCPQISLPSNPGRALESPVGKLRVGRPPASFMMLMSTAVAVGFRLPWGLVTA